MKPTALTTSELARKSGVRVDTVRFYERHGLLPEPPRTASGYREFPPESVRRLRFIRRAQALGFTLNEVRDLLGLRVEASITCDIVRKRATDKLIQIDQKIHELNSMKRALERVARSCSGRGPALECPILEYLESDEETT